MSDIIPAAPERTTGFDFAYAMTELLFHDHSYLNEFDATVTAVAEAGVALDRTAFYIGGGGQPSDIGFLRVDGRDYVVTGIKRDGGLLLHLIDGERPSEGSPVSGRIDWERRYRLMRTHTALHILCGVVWRDYGALVTGGNMRLNSVTLAGEARMDFELERMSVDFAEEVEAKINEEVAASRNVLVANLPREEAEQIPDLIRTKINLLPANIREVRTIDIQGLDVQADGGTHVKNTTEVGRIRVVGHESKGRINKRLRIALED